jgi:hypothetical protein
MSIHLLAFLCFLGLSVGGHALGQYCETRRKRKAEAEAEQASVAATLHRHTVVALVGSSVFHPTTLEALKEFAVHIVVYSGAVLPKH